MDEFTMRDAREIVEVYRAPEPREVVETYRRALPEGMSGGAEVLSDLENETLERMFRLHQERQRSKEKKRRRQRGLRIFLACVAVAVLLAIGGRFLAQNYYFYWFGSHSSWDYWDDDYQEDWDGPREITIPSWPTGMGASFSLERRHGRSLTAQEVYQQVNPSVVTVLVELGDYSAAVGTGVIFSPDGYFITNYHVVEGGVDCTVVLDSGYSYQALYVAGDEENDLAVLKMDGQDQLIAAEFGDSDLLSVGDKVYAIGNPLGVEFRGTLTDGIVSAIDRDVEVDGRTMTLIQTNAALNSGNSGGPLINEYGQVVGINVIKMSSSRSTVEGLGFAIPSASMSRLINDLVTFGSLQPEPVLGVSVNPQGTEIAPGLAGILVQEVSAGSPADKAGILAGDYIVAAGGEETGSSRDLLRVRGRCYAGDELAVTLWRDGETVEVTLVLK